MKNNQTNKPIKNFQKKKYYTNRNTWKYKVLPTDNKGEAIYYYDPQKKEWGEKIIK